MTIAEQGIPEGTPLTLEELQAQLVVSNKRYTDLQSYHDKTRTGLESQVNRLQKESIVFTPPKTAEELEDFKVSNPDWMGVIETVAHDIASNSIKPLQADLNRAKSEKAAAQLLQAHPDALQIHASAEFTQWATEQGSEIQSWLEDEFDSSKVIRALNYYKAMSSYQSAPTPTRNEPSAADAVSTHGSVVTPQTQGNQRVFTREQIEKMNQHEYAANLEAIQVAYSQGLIK